MSYRCQMCGKAQEPGSSPTMIVVEKRRVNYPQRFKGKKMIDPGGSGWETAREAAACHECVEDFAKNN